MARCHLGKGELKAAAAVLQGSPDPENRYGREAERGALHSCML